MRSGSRPAAQRGAALLLLLVLVAVVGAASAAAVSLGAVAGRRSAEQHLLDIGDAFQRALASYAGAPAGAGLPPGARGPRELEDLLRDPRVPGLRRHLRQIPADPLTGRDEWGLVRDRDGFIIGIHSLAPGRPIRQTGWPPQWGHFEAQPSYAGWVFGRPADGPAR